MMKKMTMMKTCFAALLACAGVSLFADTTINAGGDGYPWLAKSADLSKITIPQTYGSAAYSEFQFVCQGKTNTWTLSDNTTINFGTTSSSLPKTPYVNCYPLSSVGNPAVVIFDFAGSGNHTLTLGSGKWFNQACGNKTRSGDTTAYAPGGKAEIYYKGGTWQNPGTSSYFMLGGYWNSSCYYPDGLYYYDNVTITNVTDIYLNVQLQNASVVVTNQSHFYASRHVFGPRICADTQTNSTVRICGGSTISTGPEGAFYSEYPQNTVSCQSQYGNTVEFSDAGTSLSGHAAYFGYRTQGFETVFDYGASATFDHYSYLGVDDGASNCVLTIDHGSTVTCNKYLFLSNLHKSCRGATANVRNGSVLSTASTDLDVGRGASDCTLNVQDSTITAGRVVVGYYVENGPDGTYYTANNKFIMKGKGSALNLASQDSNLFQGVNGLVEFDDCNISMPDNSIRVYQNDEKMTNNWLVLNDASLTVKYLVAGSQAFSAGSTTHGCNKTHMRLKDSTMLVTDQFYMSGTDSDIILSNSCLQVDGQYSFYFGHKSQYSTHVVSNLTFTIAGPDSRIVTTHESSQIDFQSGTLEFDLTDGAYEYPALQANNIRLEDTMEFKFTGVANMQRNLDKGTDIVLADVLTDTGTLEVSDAAIAKMNAQMTATAYVYKSGNTLYLHANSNPGMRVLVR